MPGPRRRYPPDELGDELIALYAIAEGRLRNLAAAALERGALGSARYFENQSKAIRREVLRLRREAARARGDVIRSAYLTGVSAIDRVLNKSERFSGVHDAAMEVLVANLTERLRNAEDRVGREADDVFRQAALETVAVGAAAGLSPRQRARSLADDLRRRGITAFVDRRGRRWNLDTYASMVTRTTTREAMSAGMANRLRDHGRHLVKISTHANPCAICRPYQGNTYTLTEEGEPDHERLLELPPFHPNCRHVLIPATVTFERMEAALGLGPNPDVERAAQGETVPDTSGGGDDPVQAEVDRISADLGSDRSHRGLIDAGEKLDRIIQRERTRIAGDVEQEMERNRERRRELLDRRQERHEAVEAEYERAHGPEPVLDGTQEAARAYSRWALGQRRVLDFDSELRALREENKALLKANLDLEADLERRTRELTLEVLSRVRDFSGDLEVRSTRGKIAPMLPDAQRLFPREWKEHANESSKSNRLSLRSSRARAHYHDGSPWDDRYLQCSPGDASTLAHELGHYIEYHGTEELPNGEKRLERVLRAWYRERTAGESLKWLGKGYERHEKTREDKFARPYIGKDYGDGPAMEVFTMGLEGLFYGKYEMREKDAEHLHLMLGILGWL